jgi:hypothetical protein
MAPPFMEVPTTTDPFISLHLEIPSAAWEKWKNGKMGSEPSIDTP